MHFKKLDVTIFGFQETTHIVTMNKHWSLHWGLTEHLFRRAKQSKQHHDSQFFPGEINCTSVNANLGQLWTDLQTPALPKKLVVQVKEGIRYKNVCVCVNLHWNIHLFKICNALYWNILKLVWTGKESPFPSSVLFAHSLPLGWVHYPYRQSIVQTKHEAQIISTPVKLEKIKENEENQSS